MPGQTARENGKKGGRPKGRRDAAGLEKDRVLAAMRQRILERAIPMAEAQCSHAEGVRYLMLRRPDGTYTRATDQKQVDAAVAAGDTFFELYTQAPNTQAFVALMDRTFGKPAESVTLTGAEGGPIQVTVKVPWRQSKK